MLGSRIVPWSLPISTHLCTVCCRRKHEGKAELHIHLSLNIVRSRICEKQGRVNLDTVNVLGQQAVCFNDSFEGVQLRMEEDTTWAGLVCHLHETRMITQTVDDHLRIPALCAVKPPETIHSVKDRRISGKPLLCKQGCCNCSLRHPSPRYVLGTASSQSLHAGRGHK